MSINPINSGLQRVRSCFAIDLQGGKLVAVRGERVRGRVICKTVALDEPSAAEALRSGAACVGCMTTRESFARWLEAPFASAGKAMKVLPTLLDVDLPFALEECVHSFIASNSTARGTTRALAVAARIQDVEKRIRTFNALGVDPILLDQEGIALWTQSLLESPTPALETDSLRIVVCLGVEHASLAIGRGAEFLSAHGMKAKDADHISRLLRAHQEPGAGMTRWIWTGPGAEDRESVARLATQLEKEWPGPSETVKEPATFLARALATRAMVSSELPCNLRAGLLTHPRIIKQQESYSRRMAIAALCAGLLLCAANLAGQGLIRHRESSLDRSFSAKARELAGYDIGAAKGEHAIKMVRDKTEKRLELIRPFLNAFKPSLVEMVDHLSDIAKKSDIRIDFLSLTAEKTTITGTAGDWNAGDQLQAYLSRAGYQARLDRKEAIGGDRVPFSLTSGGTQ